MGRTIAVSKEDHDVKCGFEEMGMTRECERDASVVDGDGDGDGDRDGGRGWDRQKEGVNSDIGAIPDFVSSIIAHLPIDLLSWKQGSGSKWQWVKIG